MKSPKDRLFLLDDLSSDFNNQHFSESGIVDMINGQLVISDRFFKKEYDSKKTKIKDWISTEEALSGRNICLLKKEWSK
ncbi:hypothetical protein, partial [Salinicoccus roseus]|uniref:hypothetical protein n=1 Tax=Salinicoccus roseus TaxID=45670 RepID=UPI003562EB7C